MFDNDIYEFDKSLLVRLEEIESVLCCKDSPVPASEVRKEWSHYVEIAIEPAGWQALWRISRVICEELGVKYPTVVYGVVDQVLHRDLKAIFTVLSVQDDNVSLPEQHEVPLEELWPTKTQENSALDIERTADCVDKLRFFYNNIFMPWDHDTDEDVDWANKYLKSRIAFYYDLKNKVIDRGMSSRMRALLSEAQYIQKRKEYLELDLSDVEEDQADVKVKNPHSDLMRLHLRLNIIKHELEMFENPEMRDVYKTIEFPNRKQTETDDSEVYVVAKTSNLSEQIEYLAKVKEILAGDVVVQISSKLQDALNLAKGSDKIYIPTGKHSIKFLVHLDNGGAIKAMASDTFYTQTHPNKNALDPTKDAVIMSQDDDSILLTFDGDFLLENVVLDCRNVRTGLVIKSGRVRLVNCLIVGDDTSSTKQGIVIFGNSSLELENCVIRNFAYGIYANQAKINVKNTTIEKCFVAIETMEGSTVELTNVDITDCKQYGVVVQTDQPFDGKMKTFSDFADLENKKGINCENVRFLNNKHGNVVVACSKPSIFNTSYMDDEDEDENAENSSYYSDLSTSATFKTSVILIEDSLIEVD